MSEYELSEPEKVEIDANVAFQMSRHFSDVNLAEVPNATGALIGFARQDVVEVTNSFPFPKFHFRDHNSEVTKLMDQCDYETHLVGIYTATIFDSFMSEDFLAKIGAYQLAIREFIVIVFDHAKTCAGLLSIRAYRFNAAALELFKNNNTSGSASISTTLSHANMFKELHVQVRVSTLSRALLTKIQPQNGDRAENTPEIQKSYILRSIRLLNRNIHATNHYSQIMLSKFQKLYQTLISGDVSKENRSVLHQGLPSGFESFSPSDDIPVENYYYNRLLFLALTWGWSDLTNDINDYVRNLTNFQPLP